MGTFLTKDIERTTKQINYLCLLISALICLSSGLLALTLGCNWPQSIMVSITVLAGALLFGRLVQIIGTLAIVLASKSN